MYLRLYAVGVALLERLETVIHFQPVPDKVAEIIPLGRRCTFPGVT